MFSFLKKRKLLSIIIPIFNTEEFLFECLESVRKASENIESQILLIDDGSNDNSSSIARSFAESCQNAEYIRKEHAGVSSARNTGIIAAKGKYMCFVDSDDLIETDMFETMVEELSNSDSDFVTCNVDRFNSQKHWDSILHSIAFSDSVEKLHSFADYPKYVYDTLVTNKMIKRDFWKKNSFSFPEGFVFEDILVSFELFSSARKISRIDDVLYHWRVREGNTYSITQSYDTVSNLQNRLCILNRVFMIAESKCSAKIQEELKRKVLNIDLKMYIAKIKIVDEETALQFVGSIGSFLVEHYSLTEISYYVDESLYDEYYSILSRTM